MNKLSLKQTVTIAGVALSFSLFSAQPAKTANFTFSLGGWQYGGNLSGSFSGEDLDNNGFLEKYEFSTTPMKNEISSFNVTFTGNLFGDFSNPTGELSIDPFFLSNKLLSSSLAEENSLYFTYSLSTSQLFFTSVNTQCSFIVLGACRGSSRGQLILISSKGNVVSLSLNTPISSTRSSSTSISAPVVTAVKQTVPEPSTLTGIVLGTLGFLVKIKEKKI